MVSNGCGRQAVFAVPRNVGGAPALFILGSFFLNENSAKKYPLYAKPLCSMTVNYSSLVTPAM